MTDIADLPTSLRPVEEQRYHAFDNLRGTLLMLLLVLHASLAYLVTPLNSLWPFKDNSTCLGFDLLALLIHTFRLPLLFLMAGFFGAMYYYERGIKQFMRNRFRRIAIPLAVFWVALTPFILAPFYLAHSVSGPRSLLGVMNWFFSADALAELQLFHLWFLYDLLIYYTSAILLLRFGQLIHANLTEVFRAWTGALIGSSWGILCLTAITTVSLVPMKTGMLETPATFGRPVPTLVANLVFVLFGWGLYLNRDKMTLFPNRMWLNLAMALLFFAGYAGCMMKSVAEEQSYHVPSIVLCGASTWLLLYAIMGMFVRYCNQPYRGWRYVSDSSYWCYLIHLPVIAWMQFLLAGWSIPAPAKFLTTLFCTFVVCLLSYQLFVRSTAIGVLINGRRHYSRTQA